MRNSISSASPNEPISSNVSKLLIYQLRRAERKKKRGIGESGKRRRRPLRASIGSSVFHRIFFFAPSPFLPVTLSSFFFPDSPILRFPDSSALRAPHLIPDFFSPLCK